MCLPKRSVEGIDEFAKYTIFSNGTNSFSLQMAPDFCVIFQYPYMILMLTEASDRLIENKWI